jgi:hypothetical protein
VYLEAILMGNDLMPTFLTNRESSKIFYVGIGAGDENERERWKILTVSQTA